MRSLVALLAIACATSLPAQQPSAPPQAPPTFRAGVDLAQIDVRVTDADGNPVSGLTADDFELLENGVPRVITTFEAVHLPLEQDLDANRPFHEPDVLSNDVPAGRVFMFALDEVAPCNALRTRHFLRQFLDRYFGPDDVGAVALVGRGLRTDGQDFTRNRRLILAAIDKFSGGFDPGCPGRHPVPGTLRGGRSQQMAGLRVLTETMARIPGRQKAMLLFTQGLDLNMFDLVDYAGGVLGLAGEDGHAMLRAATTGGVTIYPIDPTGLTPDHISLESLGSLTALAEATGGFALFNSNSFEETFERIVLENSVYYTLGFDSAYDREDGRYVRVEVAVGRPGLTVHARDGYMAPSRGERRAGRGLRTDDSAVARALASPMATSGVALRAFAASYRGPARRALVDLVVDIGAATLDLIERAGRLTGELDLRYVVTADRDKSYPVSRHTTRLDLGRDERPGTLRVMSQFELPSGRYQIRVAAGTGRTAGSVIYDLEVPDFGNGPLAMSGVSVMTATPGGMPVFRTEPGTGAWELRRCRPPGCPPGMSLPQRPLREWRPGTGAHEIWRAAPPTTGRAFAPDETLVLFAEVYDNRRPSGNSPLPPIRVETALLDATGQIARRISDVRPARTRGDAHAFNVRLPLHGLPPGLYTIRMETLVEPDAVAVVRRTVPVVVEAPAE